MCLGPLVGPPSVSNRLLGLVRRILQTVRFIKQVGSTNKPHNIIEDFQFVKTNIIIQNTGLAVKLPTSPMVYVYQIFNRFYLTLLRVYTNINHLFQFWIDEYSDFRGRISA